jgi:hypothetical protein
MIGLEFSKFSVYGAKNVGVSCLTQTKRRLKVGKNFSDRNQGYNIGLSVTVNNKEDLDIYRFHPDHILF